MIRTAKRENTKEKKGCPTRSAYFLISIFYFLLPAAAGMVGSAEAQAPPASAGKEPVVESYYKIASGKTDEWLELYRTQHLPILKQRRRDGHVLDIVIYRPVLHPGGPPWDFKVILVWRDFAAFGDRVAADAIERRLYPDWDAHRKAEQRRWEITTAHWDDLMVVEPED